MNNKYGDLPLITIVTPSYNQAEYLEETIQSVLEQHYPNLEYIVMDGGSSDGSSEIIKKYDRHLKFWQSCPDGGQSAAIAAGFDHGTGEILAWLNSDDVYENGSLHTIAEAFNSEKSLSLVYGDYNVVYPDGSKRRKAKVSFDFKICLYSYLMIPQPSAFWSRATYEAVGGLNPHLHYAMDYDLFLRFGYRFENRIRHLRQPLSTFRVHLESKSVKDRELFAAEHKLIKGQFTKEPRMIQKIKKFIYLIKLEAKYLVERRMLPVRKDRAKA